MPRVGLEPTRCYHHQILSLARLPISPPRQDCKYNKVFNMKTSHFDFLLPKELIAKYPLKERSSSRLLCLNSQGSMRHTVFSKLPELLHENDVLIFNDTKVIPARLFARKQTGGNVEILIERISDDHSAYAQVKSNKQLKLPFTVLLENEVSVTLSERCGPFFRLEFHSDKSVNELLAEVGTIPLPTYMQRSAQALDKERYQTIYAMKEGAVAAPTAGLHFDQTLFDALIQKNIKFGFITLHVGAGTFKPVRVENIADHVMHSETFEITPRVCELINNCKANKGNVIAVGTTTVRVLETVIKAKGGITPSSGETNLFIYPGYRFHCIDGLITNFHIPKSTLLMLVCAFAGYENLMTSYQVAVKEKYRFYSYGDAMFIKNAR
jgi:S-adenosylmethionine:tRNA ribosyltransferase-isomerase